MARQRIAEVSRRTAETDIQLALNLDRAGEVRVATGIAFFDHLLTLAARHGGFSLGIQAKGDLDVDYHHTVEDVGIVLGQAMKEALGDRRGIRRYGSALLPMDEALAQVALDLGGRPYLAWAVEAAQPMVRDFSILLLREFFQAWVNHAGANLHLRIVAGDEPHHLAEALCKGFGRAVGDAVQPDPRLGDAIPSTKGVLV